MQSTEVSSYQSFDTSNIRFSDYTRSLLNEGVRAGLLSEKDSLTIQTGFLNALGSVIELYTEGLSSTVASETAEELLSSLLYNTDAALIAVGDPYLALNRLANTPVFDLYLDGMKALKRHIVETTGLLVHLRRTRLQTPMQLYNFTVNRILPETLKQYDVRFAAHRLKYTLDYPLAVRRSKLRGIYQLRSYIVSLTNENDFCREFDENEVLYLYKRFCDARGTKYGEEHVNLYQLVFANALFADYLKKDPGTLRLTERDCITAEKLLGGLEESEQGDILTAAAKRLSFTHPDYAVRALDAILPQILNAIRHKTLKNYLVVEM